jgi:GxxExxY protein
MLLQEQLTEQILGAAIEVHKGLGPGMLESAYEQCLCRELNLRNIAFRRQVEMPVTYKGVKLDCGYCIDMIVDGQVIMELKSVEHLSPVHEAQLLTYMRLSGIKIGFLINFNVALLKRGIVRRVL